MSLPTVASLGEHALIQRIRARLSTPRWVVVGPGDDAAVLEYVRGTLEVLTTDALVDGVHFDRRFVPPEAIGHRALAANLSDLAAMGAEPRAALLSLVLPDALELDMMDGVLDGLITLADRHGTAVVGGNITRTPGPLTISITAVGTVRPRRVLTRSGARPGDEVYVTGTLGDAAVGLRSLQERAFRTSRSGDPGTADTLEGPRTAPHCEERYLRPTPRIRAGLMLGRNRVASSCMDLSDGLADGVRQIAEASGVGITIDAPALPLSDEARSWHQARGTDASEGALSGGDDYELLFTLRAAHRGRLRGVREHMDSQITRIGVVTRSRELVVRSQQGTRDLPRGYEHFR